MFLTDLGASYRAIDTMQTQGYRERSVSYFKDVAEAPAFNNLMKPWMGYNFPQYYINLCLVYTALILKW